jgi:hypothetical protein
VIAPPPPPSLWHQLLMAVSSVLAGAFVATIIIFAPLI